MFRMATEADALLDRLNGRRFTAGDLMYAAEIDGHTLTNYLTKTRLQLCSKSSGQGRARQFCLVDVYQITLLSRLVSITKNAIWSADALNWLLFGNIPAPTGKLLMPSPSPQDIQALVFLGLPPELGEKFRSLVCVNIRNADKVYWHRDSGDPHFFIGSDRDIKSGTTNRLVIARRGAFADMHFGGAVLNLTNCLAWVDRRLAEATEIGGAE
jgi:hypothetical protein